jgi:hypothetical protein
VSRVANTVAVNGEDTVSSGGGYVNVRMVIISVGQILIAASC